MNDKPAFPQPVEVIEGMMTSGMSGEEAVHLAAGLSRLELQDVIRDAMNEHFEATFRKRAAAMAMQGMLAEGSFHPDLESKMDSRYAVRCADALIAELDREEST